MNDSAQVPSSYEKLSYKFILDALKERQLRHSSAELPIEEVKEAVTQEVSITETIEPIVSPKEAAPSSTTPVAELTLPEGKKYFRIGEVSELVGVESYVLRYWENEFRTVRPVKSKSGHRVYSAKDVRELHLIRHLLHVDKFSVKGAKKKLQELKKPSSSSLDGMARQRQKECLKGLAQELKQLIQLARQNPGAL